MADVNTSNEFRIRDVVEKEVGTSVIDSYRLTLHTSTVDVNFEGYGDIQWDLILTGLKKVDGINNADHVFAISESDKAKTYWTGFVVVNGRQSWFVIDSTSRNIVSWRKVVGLTHKVEFLMDISVKDENIGRVGSLR